MNITIKSDLTGKVYTGTDYNALRLSCEADDKKFSETKASNEAKSNEMSKLKQTLSDNIEKAEFAVSEAKSRYAEAKENSLKLTNNAKSEANEMVTKAAEEYQKVCKQANKLITDAEDEAIKSLQTYVDEIKRLEQEKWNAVAEFERKIGRPYEVRYTGVKAQQEYDKAIKAFEDIFTPLEKVLFYHCF